MAFCSSSSATKTSKSYKLTYFDARGRGEISRMVMAAAWQKYEDDRVKSEDWPKLKPTMPQGTMPVLEIDKKIKFSQSTTIARHLAREFKIYGKNNMESTMIDQIFDTCVDMLNGLASGAMPAEQFLKEKVPNFLDILEKLVAGKGGFSVGNSVTLADLALHVYIEGANAIELLENYPKLKENRSVVSALPRIAKYLEDRPVTSF